MVKVDKALLPTIVLNTGAPQGCVPSPFLYILYTNDCQSLLATTHYFKYADDTAILALLNEDKDSFLDYQRSTAHFSTWCEDNFLHLNILKTKELVFSTSKIQIHASSIIINGEIVERVEHFKYLGIILDQNLDFNQHTLGVYKRCQQRLTAIRKLRHLSVQPRLLLLLYRSIIEPVLTYGAICFFHMLTVINRNKFLKITHLASKIIGITTPSLSDIVSTLILRKAQKILNDSEHPLHKYFILLPSGRRYRLPMCRKAKFSKSFVPVSIRTLNT